MWIAIAKIADWLLGSKIGRGLLLGLAVFIALVGAMIYFEHRGAVREIERQMQAEQKERERLADIVETANAKARDRDAENRKLERINASLYAQVAQRRAAIAGRACLDASDVRLLDPIGREPNSGVAERGPAARSH